MRSSALALLLAAAPLASAHADGIRHFNNFCTFGALRHCASVTVQVMSIPGGGTALILTIQNREGAFAAANAPGSLISTIGVSFPNIIDEGQTVDDEDQVNQGTVNGATTVGNPFSDNSYNNRGFDSNMLQGGLSGIYGCNPLPPGTNYAGIGGPLRGSWQTCGGGAAVVFTLNHPEDLAWDVNNMNLFWVFEDPDGTKTICRPGQTCDRITTVPEPVTLVLLGTGLAGVVAARRRVGKRDQV